MNERLSKELWDDLRKQAGIKGLGQGDCSHWCTIALENDLVAHIFSRKIAYLGQVQIDQYAQLSLVHHWLQNGEEIADGTAGQFDDQYPDGYYGAIQNASEALRKIYESRP